MWRRPTGNFKKTERLTGKLSRDEIAKLYVEGRSLRAIAALDGTSKSTVQHVLKILCLPRRNGGAPKRYDEAAEASRHGVSVATLLRLKAVQALGGRCRCGQTDYRVLAVNHLNGKLHKLRLSEMREIIAGKRTDVDVRCANCNVLYEYERGKHRAVAKLAAEFSSATSKLIRST